MMDKKYRTTMCPEKCRYRNKKTTFCGYCLYKIMKEREENKDADGKQKLNTLNKLIDSGANTEKKISAMGIQEIIAVPKITVPEIHIITELQDAIKSRSVIAYLAAGNDESETEETSKQSEKNSKITETDENATEETIDLNEENEESEVQNHGRFHF